MTKNGLTRSYILIGPELMRPRFRSGEEHTGHEMPLNTSGCGSQYKNRCSDGVRAVDAYAVREEYTGDEGSQNGLRME